MGKYFARFNGRRRGAIGIFYEINTQTQGETPRAAYLALYDSYEHIQRISLYEMREDGALVLVPPSEYGRE